MLGQKYPTNPYSGLKEIMQKLRIFCRDRSGTSAVEFALVAPVLILIVLTSIGFGIYLSAANALQQISADAARTAIAGLNSTERSKLASDFIASSTMDYFMLEKAKLRISVADDPANSEQFTVSVDYDARDLPIWSLYCFVLPDKHIKRFSTIRIGGL